MKTVLVTTEQVTRSMRAPRATRVLVTRGDGLAPMVSIPQGGTLRGVWLGGVRGALTEIQPEDDVVIENCVFFGYAEGINVADSKRVVIRNNLFVNCGAGFYSHPIYINNTNARAGEGTLVEGNIFLGCAGYSIHLWHSPGFNIVRNNFIADADCGIAQQGSDNDFYNNIIWSNCVPADPLPNYKYPSAYLADGARLKFRHNLFGRDVEAALLHNDQDALIRNNGFVANGITPFGNSPQVYAVKDLKELLGMSRVQVNNAAWDVQAAFGQDANALLVDETILPNAEKLRSAVNAWANERTK